MAATKKMTKKDAHDEATRRWFVPSPAGGAALVHAFVFLGTKSHSRRYQVGRHLHEGKTWRTETLGTSAQSWEDAFRDADRRIVARRGVWTPWSQVVCAQCDDVALRDGRRRSMHQVAEATRGDPAELVQQPDGQMMATCDECQAACWVRGDVALLQRLGRRISEFGTTPWRLEQTGGMCAALVIAALDREIAVVAQDGKFDAGEYEMEPNGETYWDESLRDWSSAPLYRDDGEPVDEGALADATTACAREVVRWAQEGDPDRDSRGDGITPPAQA
jgi:hypothetical protein